MVKNAARLGSLWVAPEARGAGVGASLIEVVVEWARSEGFDELRLDVNDDNASAVKLYDLRGFEPTGEVSTLPPPREHLGKHQRVLKL
jgi:ribosomal protein S18 acetylase RimI-like enzyme